MRITLAERLWAKIDKREPDHCWLWIAGKNANGYGIIMRSNPRACVLAHRLVYEMVTDTILSPRVCVLHRCDTPACCNPGHFFLGTRVDNIRDMDAKGRRVRPGRKSLCIRGHAYTPENTRWYRGARLCRRCHRERMRDWAARERVALKAG